MTIVLKTSDIYYPQLHDIDSGVWHCGLATTTTRASLTACCIKVQCIISPIAMSATGVAYPNRKTHIISMNSMPPRLCRRKEASVHICKYVIEIYEVELQSETSQA